MYYADMYNGKYCKHVWPTMTSDKGQTRRIVNEDAPRRQNCNRPSKDGHEPHTSIGLGLKEVTNHQT
jgi:hypothetical protein